MLRPDVHELNFSLNRNATMADICAIQENCEWKQTDQTTLDNQIAFFERWENAEPVPLTKHEQQQLQRDLNMYCKFYGNGST
jgi:hypothetical protein